jgi:hypothetical protein
MSKLSTHDLDREIQLVAKIREAAQRYNAEPVESDSTALHAYLAALERLAQHIEDRCSAQRLDGKTRTTSRVIPFPAANGPSPLTAA